MTGKTLLNLTDASLATKVLADGRTLGFLGLLLSVTPSEMLGLVGLTIADRAKEVWAAFGVPAMT